MQISDWRILPYKHSWKKDIQSIMNPSSLVTWPQYVMEMVIRNRTKVWRGIKKWQSINRGAGWSVPISREVAQLCQQASVICNYFPSIYDDKMVELAFREYFGSDKYAPTKIGQYRKTRLTKDGKLNITNDERATVKGIVYCYNKLINANQVEKVQQVTQIKNISEVKFYTPIKTTNASSALLEK